MNGQAILFLIFAGILLLAALRVITARNPVHAVLFLVLAFFSAACLWMLLQAEFLAIALVLVYVGAVMVLFLFVVMMLDINIDRLREGLWRNLWAGGLVAALIVLQMWLVLSQPRWQGLTQPGPGIANANNIEMLGPADVHGVRVPAADRRGAAARGDHRGDRADAARPQGHEAPGSVAAGQGDGAASGCGWSACRAKTRHDRPRWRRRRTTSTTKRAGGT